MYDPEVDEVENEDLGLEVVKRTAHWPAVAAAAIAWDAWLSLNLCPRQSWLGLILPAITKECQHGSASSLLHISSYSC